MPKKKLGRPRKFKQNLFVDDIREGLSREQACRKQGVSIKTFEYHFGKNKSFRGMVKKAENRFEKNFNFEPGRFKKDRGYSPENYFLKYPQYIMGGQHLKNIYIYLKNKDEKNPGADKEITREFIKYLEITGKNIDAISDMMKLRSTFDEYCDETNEDLGKKLKLSFEVAFDTHLKRLAFQHSKEWGPVVKIMRKWMKWANPFELYTFRTYFANLLRIGHWSSKKPPQIDTIDEILKTIEKYCLLADRLMAKYCPPESNPEMAEIEEILNPIQDLLIKELNGIILKERAL